jgi:hypothetical protein
MGVETRTNGVVADTPRSVEVFDERSDWSAVTRKNSPALAVGRAWGGAEYALVAGRAVTRDKVARKARIDNGARVYILTSLQSI